MGALFIFVRFARNAHRTSIKNTQIFPKWKSGVYVSVRLHLYKCQRSPTFLQCQRIITFPRYMVQSVSYLLHLARYVYILTHYINRNDCADLSKILLINRTYLPFMSNIGTIMPIELLADVLRYYLHML